jgi:hypothetical protein
MMKKLLLAIWLVFMTVPAFAQTDQDRYYGFDRLRTIRSASGALSAGETTTAITGVHLFTQAAIYIDITTITTTDVDDEVDFYLQTTYDGGTTWIDLANVHVENADDGLTQKTFIFISQIGVGIAQTDGGTDGTLTDDTNVDYPMGSQLRIKTAVTGATDPTYAYSASGIFWP